MLFHKNELVPVTKALLRFGPEVRSDDSELIVYVHPITENRTYESQPEYVHSRDETIAYSTNTILLLVGENDLDCVMRKYLHTDFKGNRYIILTHQHDPDPKNLSWGLVVDWIKFGLRARRIILCGAELYIDRTGHPYAGCVFAAARQLSGAAVIEIDRSRCWLGSP